MVQLFCTVGKSLWLWPHNDHELFASIEVNTCLISHLHRKCTKYVFLYELGPFMASDTRYNSNFIKQKENVLASKVKSPEFVECRHDCIQGSKQALWHPVSLHFLVLSLLATLRQVLSMLDLQQFHSYIFTVPSLRGKEPLCSIGLNLG